MLIQELFSTCAHRSVAAAAIRSIGGSFAMEVGEAASTSGLATDDFAAQAVRAFARTCAEAELRSVASAMQGQQEPILAGLQRLLCIMLAAECFVGDKVRERLPSLAPHLCAISGNARREYRR